MGDPVDVKNEIFDYLLGRLSPERSEEVEQQILASDDLHLEVESVQRELIDKYVYSELDAEDRRLVQQRLLRSDVGRRQLRFALALKAKVASAHAPRVPLTFTVYALAACLLVTTGLAITTAWLGQQLRRERDLEASLQQELEKVRRQAGAAHGGGWSAQDPVVIAELDPGNVRGGELPEIFVPSGVRGVQFFLRVPVNVQGKVSVQLLNDEGHVLDTTSGIDPQELGPRRVVVTIFPTEHLGTGNYFLEVRGTQNASTRLRYSVKVRNR
jgi:hypothetical protein